VLNTPTPMHDLIAITCNLVSSFGLLHGLPALQEDRVATYSLGHGPQV